MKKHKVFPGLLLTILAVALFLSVFPVTVKAEGQWNHYFGQLHAHSGMTDTLGDPAVPYDESKKAMDFFGLTDFSHSFLEDTWEEGKAAAQAASEPGSFAALYGYETTSRSTPKYDHLAIFATQDYMVRGQEGLKDVTDYLDILAATPGAIGMFCHPDPIRGDFAYFMEHRWDWDDHMPLLEVIGEDGETFYFAYQTALDLGWHVAPAANSGTHDGNWTASSVRTAILADSLTEDSLYDAIRARRVYATTNPNLKITYRLGGHIMGSQAMGLGSHQVTLQLSHPEGNVHVVTSGGKVLKSLPAEGDMAFDVEPGHPFYYICLEKEGDVLAITAPVWVEEPAEFGASELSASASVPVQGEEVTFSFTLYNHESAEMYTDSIRLLADGEAVWEAAEGLTLVGLESKAFSIPYTHNGVGITEFSLEVSGIIGSKPFKLEKSLDISYRPAILNAHILVDGRHSSITYDQLTSLTALAAEADMDVGIFRDETPEGARVMIIPALERDFEEDYPQLLRNFVEKGGQLILCGSAADNSRMNRLLEALGSTMGFYSGEASDPVHNGGLPGSLYPDTFNTDASCWASLTGNEVYSQQFGCAIDPGSGTWLVKGKDTMEGTSPFLLAQESLGEGLLTIGGSFFLDDEHLVLPQNLWDTPRANQIFLESILELQRQQLPISGIQSVRAGELEGIYRVRGYVTAGTSREHNRFPGLIYLQDSTGGIEITSFELPDIQVGFALDITGQLHMDGNNPALKLVSCRIIENDLYRHDPALSDHKTAMDYSLHGGELMKIEGRAEAIEYTPDGLGVRRFTLRDENGDPAVVLIEDYILSGADGVNHLAQQVMEGEQVRAYGILHLEADGTPVLRVRNCDEVVYIPPIPEKPEKEEDIPDLSNPKTGDPFARFFTFW